MQNNQKRVPAVKILREKMKFVAVVLVLSLLAPYASGFAAAAEAVDKAALNIVIEEAGYRNENNYATPSWSFFQAMLTTALDVQANADATPAQVSLATRNLQAGLSGLTPLAVPRAANREALAAALAEAASRSQSNYTGQTWNMFALMRNMAQAVYNHRDSSQAQVDTLSSNLSLAMLRLIPDASAAAFEIFTHTTGNGTISISPARAPAGTTVNISAAPDEGYRFVAWGVISGGINIPELTNPSQSFIMPDNHVGVWAYFESATKNHNDITLTRTGNGTATSSHASAEAGETVYISAVPDEGHFFEQWEIISGAIDIPWPLEPEQSFTMEHGPVELLAVFEPIAVYVFCWDTMEPVEYPAEWDEALANAPVWHPAEWIDTISI